MRKTMVFVLALLFLLSGISFGSDKQARREKEIDEIQKKFQWWPTDAKPAPVKDEQKGGYWWWPSVPGEARPWGNRGHVYVYKIIFDYKEEELPPPKENELRPCLIIKKIVKNVKVYFDYDKADLRDDAVSVLEKAVYTLKKNPDTDILVTGNCDQRGGEAYNMKLGKRRAEAVKSFMLDKGIEEARIRIISRGKLDAIAPVTDIVGMQKDRNAQFMIAAVEEVMMPYMGKPPAEGATEVEEGKYIVEEEQEVESEIKVSTVEYTVKKGDSLWKIAQDQLGDGHKWQYLYKFNEDRIKDPKKLKAGQKILIPQE